VTQDKAGAGLDAGGGHGCHHLLHVGERGGQRLLTEDVLAALGRPQHQLLVAGRGYAHVDDVDVRRIDHLRRLRRHKGDFRDLGERAGAPLVVVADRDVLGIDQPATP